MRHAKQRLYVGPNTTEIILTLGRVHQTSMARQGVNVRLELDKRIVKRSRCSTRKPHAKFVAHNSHDHSHPVSMGTHNHTSFELVAYSVDKNGAAHFQLSDAFLVNAEKGFYDVILFMGDCKICDLEIVKAPSIFISNTESVDNDCSQTEWVEPNCESSDCGQSHQRDSDCSCINKSGGKCVNCNNEVVITTADINPDYINLGLM